MVFTANMPYTMVFIHPQSGETLKDEIVIVGINTKLGRCLYKSRSNPLVLTLPESMKNRLIFQGHNLPFLTGEYLEKGCFHFLDKDREKLSQYLKDSCLNLDDSHWSRIRISTNFIPLSTYCSTLKHDHGCFHIEVTTNSDQQGAIDQIMARENCPRSAIVEMKLINARYIF